MILECYNDADGCLSQLLQGGLGVTAFVSYLTVIAISNPI